MIDDYHGTKVADPFRWLEASESKRVAEWTDEQNARTRAYLEGHADLAGWKARAEKLLGIGLVNAPVTRKSAEGKNIYFHTKREGGANQPTLYVREGDAKDRVLIDASTLSKDGTTALDWWYASWDGRYVAWGRSESGSEESTLAVRDVRTGKDLPDAITRTRHATVAWLPDATGFFYSRYPEQGTVPKGDEKYHAQIYLHRLGSNPDEDELVFGSDRDKTDVPQVLISPNGRWLVVRVHQGWDKSELYLRDLQEKGGPRWSEVAVRSRALFEPIPLDDKLYVLTNDGAPKYALFEASYKTPDRTHWKEIISETEDVLVDVTPVKSELVATYLHDASTQIVRYDLAGKRIGSIGLRSLGTASVVGRHDGREVFVSFNSFAVAPEIRRVDLDADTSALWDRVGAEFSAPDIKVEMMWAKSKDGTRVPMFVVYKHPLKADANNRTVLYGYGGFNINQTPKFHPRILATVQAGGVWVSAVLRGGGEFGESWHRAGMLESKQHVFDDFIACAEELIRRKITRPERLGVMGGSNGGLLVAAVVTQRPELFRVGLSLVPLTDMLRYHHFRIAKLWIPEYGSAEDPSQFRTLYAYSPYHRVKKGVRYPSMLFTTAESDSRVDPMHARKMAARMQSVQSDPERPILVRIEKKAGHGAGKPTSKVAAELADEMAFLFGELDKAR